VATELIDLRSDTVTKPCDKMCSVMASADVYGEDPTVRYRQATGINPIIQ
jgi:threonine aldolase